MNKSAYAICLDCNEKIVGELKLGPEYFLPSQRMANAGGQLYGWCANHHSGNKDRNDNSKPQHSRFLVKDDDDVVLGTMRATSQGPDAVFTILNEDIKRELNKEIQGGKIESR